MKKLRLGVLFCLAVSLLSGCQIYSVVKDATDREEGRVVMKDGTEYVGRVKMPKCNTQNIRIKTTDGQKLKLKNTDIEVLGVWKKTHTDKCHFLVCHPYKTNKMFSTKKEKTIKPQWMALEAQGDYVEFYSCSYKGTYAGERTKLKHNMREYMIGAGPGVYVYNGGDKWIYADVLLGYGFGEERKASEDSSTKSLDGFAAAAQIGAERQTESGWVFGANLGGYFVGGEIRPALCLKCGLLLNLF